MSEIDELRAELRALKREIEEIRDAQTNHLGFDWGNTGPNYPHPNQQITVAEFGGGVMRLDRTGIQIVAVASLIGLYYVPRYMEVPVPPYSYVEGVGGSSDNNILIGSSFATGTSAEVTTESGSADNAVVTLRALTAAANEAKLRVVADDSDLGYIEATLGPFHWPVNASDYSNITVDGRTQYQSTTDKFRGRANGATDNFAMEAWVTATAPMGSGSTLTISLAGAVTVTDGYHLVDTNASGATDDLDTISGSVAGKLYLLRAANGARDVVVKNGTGNIFLAGSDFTLNNTNDTILLFSNGTNLYEVARADNGA